MASFGKWGCSENLGDVQFRGRSILGKSKMAQNRHFHTTPSQNKYQIFQPHLGPVLSSANDFNLNHSKNVYKAESHSSVGTVADLRTGGRWFDLRLSQYSF